MCHLNSFLNSSFFAQNRLLFKEPEAAPSGSQDIRKALRSLEQSEDNEALRWALKGLIESEYSEYGESLSENTIGELLEAIAEIQGTDSNDSPSEIVSNIFGQAFKLSDPEGKDRETQELFERVQNTLPDHAKKSGKASQEVQKRGAELIDSSSERFGSDELERLQVKYDELIERAGEFAKRVSASTVKVRARESALNELLESQGLQHDSTGKAENFYFFTPEHSVVWGKETRQRSEAELAAAAEATDTWRKAYEENDRLRAGADSLDREMDKYETLIQTTRRKATQTQ